MSNIQESVFDKISDITKIDVHDIKYTDQLALLGINSLLLVELIIMLEEYFNLLFDESELNPANLKIVNDIVKLVEKTKKISECFNAI